MNFPGFPSAVLVVIYVITWLVGLIFQWRVWRRIKALAAEDATRFDVSQEFLHINSVQRSRWFLGYLLKKKYEDVDDVRLHRNCRILRFSLVVLVVLLVALAVDISVSRENLGMPAQRSESL